MQPILQSHSACVDIAHPHSTPPLWSAGRASRSHILRTTAHGDLERDTCALVWLGLVWNGRADVHACMELRHRGLLLACSEKGWLFSQYRVWGSRDDSLGSFRSPKSTEWASNQRPCLHENP